MSESIYISMSWAGKLVLWENNKRNCQCRMCRCELKTGEGYHFKKARLSRLQSGFICKDCVAGFMKTAQNWHWNPFVGCLFPAIMETTHPRKGVDLAAAWLEGGMEELEKILSRHDL